MPYVPPNMREKGIVPQKIKLNPAKVTDTSKTMTKWELFEKIRLENYGKADKAWSRKDGV
jgi:hypothetical protein